MQSTLVLMVEGLACQGGDSNNSCDIFGTSVWHVCARLGVSASITGLKLHSQSGQQCSHSECGWKISA
jgi:hypothetical protein